MPTCFPALSSSILLLITINLFGFSKRALPDLNYCTPLVVKENISIEKLQIGNWTATQPGVIVSMATLGSNPTYDFSIQGLPTTRDSFYWQIWIDLNQDLDFDDAGEALLKTANPRKQKAQGKISFPSALYGNARVRIMLTHSKPNNPCGTAGKVLGYFDFWLEGNCFELSKTRWKIEEVRQNQVKLSFNWPASTTFHWQLKGEKETNWGNENRVSGDTLVLQNLNDFNVYSFRYRLKCGDANWTEWSDTIRIETLPSEIEQICPAPSLDSVTVSFTNKSSIKLTYTGKTHSKVIWNYPSNYQNCIPRSDTTQGELNVGYRNGERILVRLKGVCAWGESSSFSDTLNFERPCVAPKTSDFFVYQITDHGADVWVLNVDQCSGAYIYYVTTDTTLHDSLWNRLPDLGGGQISLQNLQPNTQYFLKISNQCYNDQKSVVYSGFKPFETLSTVSTCEAFDSGEISFRFDGQEQLLWLRVKSSKVSVAKELTFGDANEYEFATEHGFTGDSISFSRIATDTKYRIRIQNTCGTFKSEWTTVTYGVTADCPKMNSARLRYSLKDNKYYLGYDVNPELPIPGPYLLRYRTAVYGSPWVDTLLLDTNALEIPTHLLGQYVAFSIRPLSNLACGEEYWSSDFILELTPCPAPLRADFALKSASSNSATFYIRGDRLPDNTSLRVYDPGGSVPEFEIDLSPSDTEVTIDGLVPNFRYYASLCSHCQIGPTSYGNCLATFDFKTPKESMPPNLGVTIAKTIVLNNLKLVPNPSTGLFQVELPRGLEGTAILTITNLNGQLIQRTPMQLFPGAQPQIDLSQQAQGVYFIHVQVGKQLYREKLVLIR